MKSKPRSESAPLIVVLGVFLIFIAMLAASISQGAAITVPNGTYTATVGPNGITFVEQAPPCTWPPVPSTPPACPDGSLPTGGTWQQGACPVWTYVGGTCGNTAFQWQAPRDPSSFSMAKPAKGTSWTTPYGTTEQRMTDHAVDIAGSAMARNDYSRRQPFNADGTRLLVYTGSGYWGLYNTATRAYVGRLAGPAGDAEIQWDVTDPNVLYYLDNNGGTVLRRLNVTTGVASVQYDFTSAVRALWSTAARCWTKSEGSPSRDGKLWGLMCETNGFAPLGFVVLDVVNKRVVWSKANTVRPDHVSMSPSGRWFVVSGDDARGTIAYKVDGSGATRQLHAKSEHSDLGVLPSGNDFYVSVNYQTNDGDIFVVDLDAGTKRTIDTAYHNPWSPSTYSMHFSAKAFNAPGWVVESRYGAPAGGANLVLINVVTGRILALGVNYPPWSDYFDEPHATASRDLKKVVVNGSFGTSKNIDVYQINVPVLP